MDLDWEPGECMLRDGKAEGPRLTEGEVMQNTTAREQTIAISQIKLILMVHDYQQQRNIDDVEILRLITMEIRSILLDMEPKIARADRFSDLKDFILDYQRLSLMTDVETLEALFEFCHTKVRYMKRVERA